MLQLDFLRAASSALLQQQSSKLGTRLLVQKPVLKPNSDLVWTVHLCIHHSSQRQNELRDSVC